MEDPGPSDRDTETDVGVPSELKDTLANFDTALSNVEKNLQPWLETPESDLKDELSPIEKAKLDLVGAYTINSLFWMYLNVCGVNPKEHPVKQELDRMKSYMNRVRDIQEKSKAAKLDKGAAKRFVRSALWQAAQNKNKTDEGETEEQQEGTGDEAVAGSSGSRKRKGRYTDAEFDEGAKKSKKKRKKNKKRHDT